MRKLKQFFLQLKNVWEMPNKYEKQCRDMYNRLYELHQKINENTTVHADIGYKGTGSQIIVVGRYKNKDYVRSFNVRSENLNSLIELLRREEEGAKVGRSDMPGGMEFSAVYDRYEF